MSSTEEWITQKNVLGKCKKKQWNTLKQQQKEKETNKLRNY